MPGRSGGGSGQSGHAAARGATDPDRWFDPDVDGPADPESVARLICLRLLTAEPRTRAELADALRRRRVPADAAEKVLSRFSEVGLIDDATFASAWVESRHHRRGLGRRALAADLGRRGVGQADILAAIDRLTVETERATALALVERKIASTAGQPHAARVRRLVGMLARKGYSAGLAYSVVREALERAGQGSLTLGPDEADEFGLESAEGDELG